MIKAINLSILDFKFYMFQKIWLNIKPINLSILDFKSQSNEINLFLLSL